MKENWYIQADIITDIQADKLTFAHHVVSEDNNDENNRQSLLNKYKHQQNNCDLNIVIV